MGDVCSVQSEQKKGLGLFPVGPRTAEDCVQHTVPGPHILWPVGEVVEDPECNVLVHPRDLQLVPRKFRLYAVKNTR